MKRLLLLTILIATFTSYAADTSEKKGSALAAYDNPALPPQERMAAFMVGVFNLIPTFGQTIQPENAQQFGEKIVRILESSKSEDRIQKEIRDEINQALVERFNQQTAEFAQLIRQLHKDVDPAFYEHQQQQLERTLAANRRMEPRSSTVSPADPRSPTQYSDDDLGWGWFD